MDASQKPERSSDRASTQRRLQTDQANKSASSKSDIAASIARFWGVCEATAALDANVADDPVPPDPVPDGLFVLVAVVAAGVVAAETPLLTVAAVLDCVLPVSCTERANAVKPAPATPPACGAPAGALGEVMPDCLKFAYWPSNAESMLLINPAPL